jgi:alpha-L-fucosidase
MKLKHPLFILALLFVIQLQVTKATPLQNEAAEGSEFERQKDSFSPELIESLEQLYHDKIGMFIHWGPYAQIGGAWKGIQNAEWIMRHAKIPVADYEAVAARPFNPTKFNAEEWIGLCKDAGMGFIVITSKHHDGFAMFDSEHPYNITDFGDFGRDPLVELHRECMQEGIRFGVYYSQSQDWHEPGGGGNGWQGWPKLNRASFEHYYREKALLQIEELVTRFDPLYMIWFDTPGQFMSPEVIEATMGLVNTHQPHVLMNSRIGGGYGHFESATDGGLMPCVNTSRWKDGIKVPWQTHSTVAGSWGYALHNKHLHENPDRPADNFIYELADIVSKGGVLLLNVAPNELGEIPIGQANVLRRLGQWLKVNGAAIYDADPSPIRNPDLPITHKPGTLFFHVKKQAKKEVEIEGMTVGLKHCYLLSDPKKTALDFSQNGDQITLSLPQDAFEGAQGLAVIAAEYEGEIQVSNSTLVANKEGLIQLPVSKSTYSTMSISYDPNFGCTHKIAMPWDKGGKSISWKLRISEAGTYRVMSEQSFAPGLEGARYQILVNDQKLETLPLTSKHGRDFIEVEIGSVQFDAPGDYALRIVMLDGARDTQGASRDKSGYNREFSLRRIELRPDI